MRRLSAVPVDVIQCGSFCESFQRIVRSIHKVLQVIVLNSAGQLAEKLLHLVRSLLQVCGGPTCCRRGIIEFVREARGHGA
jgi:hypothetical protein